jgi:hypothetical protein
MVLPIVYAVHHRTILSAREVRLGIPNLVLVGGFQLLGFVQPFYPRFGLLATLIINLHKIIGYEKQ